MDSKFKFRITPNFEPDKRHNSIDDLMRLGMYTEKNIKGREVDLTTLTKMLSSAPHSRFPLWVNISVSEMTLGEKIRALRKVNGLSQHVPFCPYFYR